MDNSEDFFDFEQFINFNPEGSTDFSFSTEDLYALDLQERQHNTIANNDIIHQNEAYDTSRGVTLADLEYQPSQLINQTTDPVPYLNMVSDPTQFQQYDQQTGYSATTVGSITPYGQYENSLARPTHALHSDGTGLANTHLSHIVSAFGPPESHVRQNIDTERLETSQDAALRAALGIPDTEIHPSVENISQASIDVQPLDPSLPIPKFGAFRGIFSNAEEAKIHREMPKWRPSDNWTPSEDEWEPWIQQIYDAMVNTDDIEDPRPSDLTKRWHVSYWVDKEIPQGDIEARAWEVMEALVKVHQHGCVAWFLPEHKSKQQLFEKNLNFTQRHSQVCRTLRLLKSECKSVMAGDGIDMLVYGPGKTFDRAMANISQNLKKRRQIGYAKENMTQEQKQEIHHASRRGKRRAIEPENASTFSHSATLRPSTTSTVPNVFQSPTPGPSVSIPSVGQSSSSSHRDISRFGPTNQPLYMTDLDGSILPISASPTLSPPAPGSTIGSPSAINLRQTRLDQLLHQSMIRQQTYNFRLPGEDDIDPNKRPRYQ